MAWSKLSLPQDLFGDNIMTWQHFFFIEKHVICFPKNYVILCTLVILLPRFFMYYLGHLLVFFVPTLLIPKEMQSMKQMMQ